jgi:glucose-1-phosphate cytidylyltransferase
MRDKEELVNEPFQRLIRDRQLTGYQYDGFWAGMDTFKDKQHLDSLYSTGAAPWEVWRARSQVASQEHGGLGTRKQGGMGQTLSKVAC